jgi:hypothetical protein
MSAEIGILVGVVLAIAVVILVTRPLRAPTLTDHTDESPLSDLLARREAAYQVLRDLDSDFTQGKLSEDDYRPMRVQALAHAAEIVAQIDRAQSLMTGDGRRETRDGGSIASVQSSTSKRSKPKAAARHAFCPSCGAAHEPADAFCRKCGKALKP